jgi:hypothetical protein
MLTGEEIGLAQRFDRTAAQANSGLLLVTVTALILPAVLIPDPGRQPAVRRSRAPILRQHVEDVRCAGETDQPGDGACQRSDRVIGWGDRIGFGSANKRGTVGLCEFVRGPGSGGA